MGLFTTYWFMVNTLFFRARYLLFYHSEPLKYYLNSFLGLRMTQLIYYQLPLTDGTDIKGVEALIPMEVKRGEYEEVERLDLPLQQRESYKSRLKRGDIFICAQGPDGRILGYMWASLNTVYLTEVEDEITMGANEAWLYDAYVFPEYRNRKVIQKTLAEGLGYLKGIGVRRVRLDVEKGNIPSRRGVERAGFRKEGEGTYIKIFGRRLHRSHSARN